jgi:hypothetical protein
MNYSLNNTNEKNLHRLFIVVRLRIIHLHFLACTKAASRILPHLHLHGK